MVDLAAPIAHLSTDLSPLQSVNSGPMITAEYGYPTQSWGSAGYGTECGSQDCIRQAIQHNKNSGARLIKVPITAEPTLNDTLLNTLVTTAQQEQLPVVAHALGDAQALRARVAGISILAHTPTQPMSEQTLEAWHDGTIISTLQAFSSLSAVNNLSTLHQRGATILYGTDLGNVSQPGILYSELEALTDAGLSPQEIINSATALPAQLWGLSELGHIAANYRASFLILDSDPTQDLSTLTRPVSVWIDGRKRPL